MLYSLSPTYCSGQSNCIVFSVKLNKMNTSLCLYNLRYTFGPSHDHTHTATHHLMISTYNFNCIPCHVDIAHISRFFARPESIECLVMWSRRWLMWYKWPPIGYARSTFWGILNWQIGCVRGARNMMASCVYFLNVICWNFERCVMHCVHKSDV